MKTFFISYVKGEKYQHLIQKQKAQAGAAGFNYSIIYQWEDLEKTAEYLLHKDLYDEPKGAGFWLWKSYYLLRTMKELDYGDLLFYCDAGDAFDPSTLGKIMGILKENNGRFLLRHVKNYNYQWVKEYLFKTLDTDNRDREALHIEAGVQGWIKTSRNMEFIEEWHDCCCNRKMIDGEDYGMVNESRFIDDRHDQSIFSILAEQSCFKTVPIVDTHSWIQCNKLSGELP